MPTATATDIDKVCQELQVLQRHRTIVIKSRIMQANRLQAIVAGSIGYSSGMPEKERLKKFVEASKLIRAVVDGDADCPLKFIILTTMVGIDAFRDKESAIEKEQGKLAKTLPVAAWVTSPQQKGFGLQSLATVVGETGNLSNYANPAKVWRRMGCAPHQFDGKTLMGATWKSGREGKLPAAEWESFGYSPRRRSISFVIGENLVKQNGRVVGGASDSDIASDKRVGADDSGIETECCCVGPYRARYDESKAAIKEKHPDYSDLRCHRHGMLLATKLLLKNLWIEWSATDASHGGHFETTEAT